MRLPHEVSISQEEQKKQETPNNLSNIEKIIQQLKIACENNNYEEQAKNYFALGNIYFKEKHDYINAIAIYNFALALCQDEKKQIFFKQSAKNLSEEIICCIKFSEQQFLLSLTGRQINASDYKLDLAHKKYLKGIRNEARAKLEQWKPLYSMVDLQAPVNIGPLDKHHIIQQILEKDNLSIKQIYKQIGEQMRGFVKLLIDECKKELSVWKKPPSEEDYAVICFGSLARDEATPYSDLEFGILLREGTDTEENKEYFRNLTKLLNIKIINLGETTPRIQYIQEFKENRLLGRYSESPTKRGFCFDGNNKEGRKTPLGNKYFNDISEDKKYELILTPAKMAELHNEINWHKDKSISIVLRTFKLIDGDKSLVNSYALTTKVELDRILDLQEKSSIKKEQTSTLIRQNRALLQLSEDLDKFQLDPFDPNMTMQFYSVKYDFYRLLGTFIDNLSLYYDLEENEFWERVNKLLILQKMNDKGAMGLIYLHSLFIYIRLSAFLSRDNRDERIILELPSSFNFMIIGFIQNAIEIVKTEKNLVNLNEIALKKTSFNPTKVVWKHLSPFFSIRDGSHSKAIEDFMTIISDEGLGFGRFYSADDQKILGHEYLLALSSTFILLDHIMKAKSILEVLLEQSASNNENLTSILINIACCYHRAGDYNKQIEFLERAKKICEEQKEQGEIRADILLNLSIAYANSHENMVEHAKILCQLALGIYEGIYKEMSSYKIGIALANLSDIYSKTGDYQQQKNFLNQALEIEKEFFPPDHPYIKAISEKLHAISPIMPVSLSYNYQSILLQGRIYAEGGIPLNVKKLIEITEEFVLSIVICKFLSTHTKEFQMKYVNTVLEDIYSDTENFLTQIFLDKPVSKSRWVLIPKDSKGALESLLLRTEKSQASANFRGGSPITAVGNAHNILLMRAHGIIGTNLTRFQPLIAAIEEKAYAKALRRACTGSGEETQILISILLEYKQTLSININEQAGDKNYAAIHYAAIKGNKILYDLLVAHGAEVNLEDEEGISAAEYMKNHEEKKLSTLLRK